MNKKIQPYSGCEKYVFVSYCHKDEEKVFPIIEYLALRNYRVWYDDMIDPGEKWPDVIAEHLNNCSLFISCISESSVNSHNCHMEINYAVMKQKPFLAILLDNVTLSPVMEMQMSMVQCIKYFERESMEEFFGQLMRVSGLNLCLNGSDTIKPEKKAPVFSLKRVSTGEIILINKREFKFGRKPEHCDYSIVDNPALTRLHAVFSARNGRLFVRDNNSTNYTKINGIKLIDNREHELKDGDIVVCANEKFEVIAEFVG